MSNAKYFGFIFDKRINKYRATIMINGSVKYLGDYLNKFDAAKAYDNEVRRLGLKRRLNFPNIKITDNIFGIKFIQLTQGKVALVDDWNYDRLMQWKWYAKKGTSTYYAERNLIINGQWNRISMQNEIMNPPEGKIVDHQDHNGLNCLESNMRIATNHQNQMNKSSHVNSTSKYLGVSKWSIKKNDKIYQYFTARLCFRGKLVFKKYCKKETEAALAYNDAAMKYFGEFANLNQLI